MSAVSQTAGPISRELRHDSDLRRLVAGSCDSERKEKDGEGRGRELKRIRNRVRWRVSERECLVLFTQHRRDEQLAMNT